MLKEKKFWIGILLSGICLYFFSKKIDPHALLKSLQEANYYYLIPSVFCLLLSFYLRALRWDILLMAFGKIGVSRLMAPLMIGFMGNSVLPARMGEIIRAFVLTKKENVNFSASVATIVVERIFDTLTILLFLAFILFFFPLPPYLPDVGIVTKGTLQKLGYISLSLCLFGFLVLIAFRWNTTFCLNVLTKILKPFPKKFSDKVIHLSEQFSHGLSVFKNWKGILLTLFYSILVWCTIAVGNYFVFLAFHLNSLPLNAAVFVLVVIAFGVAVPSAPAYIGIYQIACQVALEAYGVDGSKAGSIAWVLWASQVFPVVAIGLYYLWKENLSLKQLREIKG